METKKKKFTRFIVIVFLATIIGIIIARTGGPGFGFAVVSAAGIYEWFVVKD